MPNYNDRKRLKKKMLDRWENEGGRICADPTTAPEGSPTITHEGEGNQPSTPQDNSSTFGAVTSPSKKRKSTRKRA